jgi:hypothetical protein
MKTSDLALLVNRQDVVWIGERHPRELFDEKQGQIIAGTLKPDQTGPTGPGYLAFLTSLGFSQDPLDYPIVDITDDGIGNGDVTSGDPTFHVAGDISNPTRLYYIGNCTSASTGEGVGGHGHINTSIVGGYDTRSGSPYQDDNGYQRGMGINPFGRLAGTRIFDTGGYNISNCGGTDSGLIETNYNFGAVISSNSWGCSSCSYSYDDSSQAYDVGVRDASPDTPGNQELIFVFAAGNSGPSPATIGTPGNGKNMITVGASENDRPTWTDGCGKGPSDADNAMDVAGFSSRGPAPGGRIKPEVIAPGTHIQGTACTGDSYSGSSVCDMYQPGDQLIFAASSGTSHSTPAISGLCSLTYYWIMNNLLVHKDHAQVSPALMKAYLMAHAGSYLTGSSADDDLPSNNQGYGMPDMAVCFDDSVRYLIDQSEVFDNSGETWTITGSIADSSRPVRIAMAYTDQAGSVGTSPQVNDLDLVVTVNGTVYQGNVFTGQWSVTGGSADSANNYEAVFLPAGTTGSVEITVNGVNIAGDGVPNTGDATDQDFALVAYNFAQVPDYYLRITSQTNHICVPTSATYAIEVGSILGYTDDVTLQITGLPAGLTAQLGSTTITPGNSTTLTVSGTDNLAAGDYTFNLNGSSTSGPKSLELSLKLKTAAPSAPVPASPLDGAVEVGRKPVLTWSASTQGETYHLEVSTSAAFSTNLYDQELTGTTFSIPASLDSLTTYYWRLTAGNVCGDSAVSPVFSFTTLDQPDYFTELFSATHVNDMSHVQITLTPDGTGDFYDMCGGPATVYPVDPADGTALTLADDATIPVTLTTPVQLYGLSYSTVNVSSNGYITFNSTDTGYTETLANHFGKKRIAGAFDDLNPSSGGTISYQELPDQFVITYDAVREYGSTNTKTVSFQIQMFHDGVIQITWLQMDIEDGLAGISAGNGVPTDYLISDLSTPGDCTPPCPADLNHDQMIDDADLSEFWPLWAPRASIADVNLDLNVNILDALGIQDNPGTCPTQ